MASVGDASGMAGKRVPGAHLAVVNVTLVWLAGARLTSVHQAVFVSLASFADRV